MLRQKLQDQQLAALKGGDKVRLETLRFVLARIKNQEIEKKSELNDDETIQVLKKFTRELKETIEAAVKGAREDLKKSSQEQLEIIAEFLPAELSDDDLKKEIEKILETNKDVVTQNPKAIIGICMKELRSKADPSRIMPMLQSIMKA